MKKNGKAGQAVMERSVVNQNGTLYVSIPKTFAEKHGIHAGDRLPIILDGRQMRVIPHEKPGSCA
jgi:bifunctional DNA-binding transcriptional regulator/antitoxin component of YhaV-PrlF toxin-antitoxin module